MGQTEIPKGWEQLLFWNSGEWQVLEERLDDWDTAVRLYNPPRDRLFRALDLVPLKECRVVLVGQDPYPDRRLCTGVAFSVPKTVRVLPPSLITILKELRQDMGYPELYTHGNLEKWCRQGVLLWNAVPTCDPGRSLSHSTWTEWSYLTNEIVSELDKKGRVVFVFVGSKAREYSKILQTTTLDEHGHIDKDGEERSSVLYVGHPSPLNKSNPFLGSRIFSKINHCLVQEHGLDPIDWRL